MLCRVLVVTVAATTSFAADWSQFRGPNGSGVGDAVRLPAQFGPDKNVVWKTPVPFGHSSPVIGGELIFITAAEGGSRADAGREKVVDQGGKLYTLAIERGTGKILCQAIDRQRVPYFSSSHLDEPGKCLRAILQYLFYFIAHVGTICGG